MAAFRINRPTIIIYGGTIQPGVRHLDCPALGFKKGDPVNIGEAFESYGLSSTESASRTESDIHRVQVRTPLGKSLTRNVWMLSGMLVPGLVLAAGCLRAQLLIRPPVSHF